MKAGGQGDERRRMLILENEDKLLQGFKQKKPGIILELSMVQREGRVGGVFKGEGGTQA